MSDFPWRYSAPETFVLIAGEVRAHDAPMAWIFALARLGSVVFLLCIISAVGQRLNWQIWI